MTGMRAAAPTFLLVAAVLGVAFFSYTRSRGGEMPADAPSGAAALVSGAPTDVQESGAFPASLGGDAVSAALPLVQALKIPAPKIHAEAVLIADAESGEVYFEYRSSEPWPAASLTKLVTAAVALREFSFDRVIDADLGPSRGRYTVHDLVQAMLVASSNTAAEALARAYGRDAFVQAMNDQAAAWGLRDTFFEDPVGLSPYNKTTAANLGILSHRLYRAYPEIFLSTREREARVLNVASGNTITLQSTNVFPGRVDFLGGKTGFTDEANGNLLSLFIYRGRPIVVVVLGTDDRFGETARLLEWFESAYR